LIYQKLYKKNSYYQKQFVHYSKKMSKKMELEGLNKKYVSMNTLAKYA